MSPVAEALRVLDGARIAGGCENCDAYQVLTAPALGYPNVAVVNIYHDDDCPLLRAMTEGQSHDR